MSAFYKYILTTMVRSPSCSHHPRLFLDDLTSLSLFAARATPASLVGEAVANLLSVRTGLPPAVVGRCGGRPVQRSGFLHVEQQPCLLPGLHQEPQPVLEGRLQDQSVPRTCGKLRPQQSHQGAELQPLGCSPVGHMTQNNPAVVSLQFVYERAAVGRFLGSI